MWKILAVLWIHRCRPESKLREHDKADALDNLINVRRGEAIAKRHFRFPSFKLHELRGEQWMCWIHTLEQYHRLQGIVVEGRGNQRIEDWLAFLSPICHQCSCQLQGLLVLRRIAPRVLQEGLLREGISRLRVVPVTNICIP